MDFHDQMAKFSPLSHISSSAWIRDPRELNFQPHGLFPSPSAVAPLTRKVYTDYKLEKELAHLFPDFYYQFLENFSRESFLHAIYCNFGYDGLRKVGASSYKGYEQMRAKVISDFANAFHNALGSTFDEFCKQYYFTKEFIESGFVAYLLKHRSQVSDHYKVREKEVITKASEGFRKRP